MSDFFVKLGNKYNFHSLHCDISQAIGHRELILTCVPAGYFDILTSRIKCDSDLQGQRTRSYGKSTIANSILQTIDKKRS